MPLDGETVANDLLRGEISIANAQVDDQILLKSDGMPTYHLANVVDDHLMGITHVIRGEEHLSNTPRQVFISQSFGWDLPRYAHLPFVAEPGSKNKLSKRKLAQLNEMSPRDSVEPGSYLVVPEGPPQADEARRMLAEWKALGVTP